MFAIIETGGKQYRVTKDCIIDIEQLCADEGTKVTLDKVLFIQKDDGKALCGQPILSNAKVEAQVVDNYRDDKVLVFKKRRRKNSRRRAGHRQNKTKLKILNIVTA